MSLKDMANNAVLKQVSAIAIEKLKQVNANQIATDLASEFLKAAHAMNDKLAQDNLKADGTPGQDGIKDSDNVRNHLDEAAKHIAAAFKIMDAANKSA